MSMYVNIYKYCIGNAFKYRLEPKAIIALLFPSRTIYKGVCLINNGNTKSFNVQNISVPRVPCAVSAFGWEE